MQTQLKQLTIPVPPDVEKLEGFAHAAVNSVPHGHQFVRLHRRGTQATLFYTEKSKKEVTK